MSLNREGIIDLCKPIGRSVDNNPNLKKKFLLARVKIQCFPQILPTVINTESNLKGSVTRKKNLKLMTGLLDSTIMYGLIKVKHKKFKLKKKKDNRKSLKAFGIGNLMILVGQLSPVYR